MHSPYSMQNNRSIVLVVLIAYIFSPTILSWIINTDGAWYRPFIVWLAMIVIAYIYQKRTPRDDL